MDKCRINGIYNQFDVMLRGDEAFRLRHVNNFLLHSLL
jgi:hypothetical protein